MNEKTVLVTLRTAIFTVMIRIRNVFKILKTFTQSTILVHTKGSNVATEIFVLHFNNSTLLTKMRIITVTTITLVFRLISNHNCDGLT